MEVHALLRVGILHCFFFCFEKEQKIEIVKNHSYLFGDGLRDFNQVNTRQMLFASSLFKVP
jgi:hypothetical protein